MDIVTAIKKAQETNSAIMRDTDESYENRSKNFWMYNTIVIPAERTMYLARVSEDEGITSLCPRWEPGARDLLADDWVVVELPNKWNLMS